MRGKLSDLPGVDLLVADRLDRDKAFEPDRRLREHEGIVVAAGLASPWPEDRGVSAILTDPLESVMDRPGTV